MLRQRGVDVRMGTSVQEATHDGVLLTDGTSVDTRTLVWCVGVRPDPLVESLGLPMERGRLLVDPHLQVPGRPELFACGDVAAVPDLNQPGQYTPMTAQHAWRHGKVCAQNVAASLGIGQRRAYRHRDLGFVVDLGGVKAAANPLGLPMSGPAAGAVTRGYHLAAMPGNRVRVAADWLLDAVLPRQAVQLGLVRSWSVPLESASPEIARVPGGPDRTGRDTGPAGNHADGDEARNQPGGEPAKGQPGGEPAKKHPEGEPAKRQPGGEPARNQPGGEPAEHRPGTEAAGNPPRGARAKRSQSGSPRASGKPRRAVEAAGPRTARGAPGKASRAPGTGSAGKRPTAPSGPSRSAGPPTDPGPEPPANQPPPGPDIAPGPVKRTDGRAAEGDS
ncbi:FAD-dependent oxidoreductase OS=Streptomyces tendae OX=1932 GN=GUR47_01290 PE=3 SV=1 [Streptomyces tendae]